MKILSCLLLALSLAVVSPLSTAGMKKGDIVSVSLGKDQNKNPVKVENYRGKVVALVFWETGKPNALELFQLFEQLQRVTPEEDLKVIAINFKNKKTSYRKILKNFPDLKSTMVHDKAGKYAKKFDLKKSPALIILDRDGEIKYKYGGYKPEQKESRIKQVQRLIKRKHKAKKG